MRGGGGGDGYLVGRAAEGLVEGGDNGVARRVHELGVEVLKHNSEKTRQRQQSLSF